jgi:hypothetical protein
VQSKEQELVETVAQLRREVRAARRLAIASLALPVAAIAIAAQAVPRADAVLDVVRARRFEVIVDVPTESGASAKTVGILHGSGNIGVLSLTDAGGSQARFDASPSVLHIVGPTKDHASIQPNPANGKLVLAMASEVGGGMGLVAGQVVEGTFSIDLPARSPTGASVSLSTSSRSASVSVRSESSDSSVQLVAAGDSRLELWGQDQQRVNLSAAADGTSSLSLLHPTSRVGADGPLQGAVFGVLLSSGAPDSSGASISVFNKTNDEVCTMRVDEYGNGEVGAWDRKGKGRALTPGN